MGRRDARRGSAGGRTMVCPDRWLGAVPKRPSSCVWTLGVTSTNVPPSPATFWPFAAANRQNAIATRARPRPGRGGATPREGPEPPRADEAERAAERQLRDPNPRRELLAAFREVRQLCWPTLDDDAILDADALPPTCALPLNIDTGDVPYSEASRPYRRTVFTNQDWLQHRSSTRLFGNLAGTFTSGVVRSLVTEVGAVATIGAAACLWNGSIQGFEDFANVTADPLLPGIHEVFLARLPALPFTLASPALGLPLVFRTNASYARWVESRVAGGRIVSHCRNVMRQSALWMNTVRFFLIPYEQLV